MILALKFIFIQAMWFFCVVVGPQMPLLVFTSCLAGLLINYLLGRVQQTLTQHLGTVLFFVCYGLVQDSLLIQWGFLEGDSFPPLWLLGMWVIFVAYYEDFFVAFRGRPLLSTLLGAVGGSSAYWGGARLAGLEVYSPLGFSLVVAISWAIFFPLSLWLYFFNMGSYRLSFLRRLKNSILDGTVYFSFDRSGYNRHQQTCESFQEVFSGAKKVGLITGGSAGIGESAALELRARGHQVYTCGRRKVSTDHNYFQADMGDWASVNQLVKELPALDFVALNAGGMPPEFSRNHQGVELQMASQLMGHYLLVRNLTALGKLKKGARIIWMSSGGMYLKRLHLDHVFENNKYDKVETYANVKRAQVLLNEQMGKMHLFSGLKCLAMHPGWVDTEGVRESIPGFWKWTQKRLRSPSQGGDTLVWLSLTQSPLVSGGFYFDRAKVPIYYFAFTRETQKEREKLFDLIDEQLKDFYL